jgi:hypothetical protein
MKGSGRRKVWAAGSPTCRKNLHSAYMGPRIEKDLQAKAL